MARARDTIIAAIGVIGCLACGCGGRTIVAVDPAACGGTLLDGLVGYWRLDDAADSPTARDWSGQNNGGTLVGLDPQTAWVTGGPEGGALAVEGLGSVTVPPSPSIDAVTDQVTVAAWIFIQETIPDYATAISRQIGTSYGQAYHLSVQANMMARLFINTATTPQTVIDSKSTVPPKTWVHLAGTYDGAQMRIYFDGAMESNSAITGSFAAETNPVVLSGNQNADDHATTEFVQGRLAGVTLYKRALSDGEIARLHTCGSLVSPGKSF